MRTFPAIAAAIATPLGCLAADATPPAAPANPTAWFASGDQIPGTVTRVAGPDSAVFESPVLTESAEIDFSKLLEIRADTATPSTADDHLAVVTLTNGDTIRGRLSGVTDAAISLDTTAAGLLNFRRSMVDSLVINDHPRSLFLGPVSLDDWKTSSPDAWRFESGAFISKAPGSVGRDIGLPQQVSISFDLAWRGSLRFRLSFFSDQPEADNPSNSYNLVCQRRYVYLGKRWSDNGEIGSNFIGQSANVTDLGDKEKVRIELRADRKNGLFILLINDKRVATWNDPDTTAGKLGGALHFVAEDTTPLQVSRIRVTPWDGSDEEGEAPDKNTQAPADEPPASDGGQRIALRNGDSITGSVVGIENNIVTIKSTNGEIHLPVQRMRSLALHTEADKKDPDRYEQPKLMAGDIRAWFPEGGHIVFRLDSIDNGILKGYSQTFGNADFRADAFQRIEFNIHDWDLEPLRPKGVW